MAGFGVVIKTYHLSTFRNPSSCNNASQAIDLLEKLGSKCDLAEAYYQLGLVYQGMNEIEECSSNFQMAIRLFDEIKAPKQIERVRQSMQN